MKLKRTPKTDQNGFVFRAQHFYELLERQNYRCALTGRELRPENTTAEHRVPLRKGGKHELANIMLIDEDASRLKRQLTVNEVVAVAADIIATQGKDFGFTLQKRKRR